MCATLANTNQLHLAIVDIITWTESSTVDTTVNTEANIVHHVLLLGFSLTIFSILQQIYRYHCDAVIQKYEFLTKSLVITHCVVPNFCRAKILYKLRFSSKQKLFCKKHFHKFLPVAYQCFHYGHCKSALIVIATVITELHTLAWSRCTHLLVIFYLLQLSVFWCVYAKRQDT